MLENKIKLGSFRHKSTSGGAVDGWIVTQPGDPMYSTATMVAEEFYNGEKWVPLWEEKDAYIT